MPAQGGADLPARRLHGRLGERAFAAAVAGTFSGLPSTVWAAVTGRSVLEATRAAGTLIPGRRDRPGLVAGAMSHAVLSLGWTSVMVAASHRHPQRPPRLAVGAAAGLAIAVVDLGVIGRHYPAIKALPAVPQYLDHLAFGALVAACLRSDRRSGSPG